jgi:plastocyanin
VVSVDGEVTFEVAAFHKLAIYDDGTRPEDIDVSLLEEPSTPFPFPMLIDDPTNRIVRLGDLEVNGPAVNLAFTFDEPGRYLVICEVLPHFTDNGMYGWVIVK